VTLEENYKYIAIMAIVTYIPRVTPLLAMKGKKIESRTIRSFLFYMPYAVLGAMTFPAIFYSTGNMATGMIGTAVALFLSYYDKGLTKVAIYAVAASYISGYIF
jgi:branched-subunit amino acid transport protein